MNDANNVFCHGRRLWVVLMLGASSCTELSVQATNATPDAKITSHRTGEAVREGAPLLLRGIVSDPDGRSSILTASWYLNNTAICEATEAAEDGTVLCETVGLGETMTITLEVRDQLNAAAADTVVLEPLLATAPDVAILAPEAGSRFYAGEAILFQGTASDQEDPSDSLVAEWTSSADGVLPLPQSLGANGDSSGVTTLTEGDHLVTFTVTNTVSKVGADSVLIEVGPPNTAPTCTISSPVNGAVGGPNDPVDFVGQVNDPDQPLASLDVTWTSSIDGLLGTSVVDSVGGTQLPVSSLGTGLHVVSMNVTDELGETCVAVVQYEVGAPPEVTIDVPVSGTVVNEGEVVTFSGTVSDDQDPPDSLSLSWDSSLDGTLGSASASPTGDATATGVLSRGTHVVTLAATDGSGMTGDDSVIVTVNGVPGAPAVVIDPSAPSALDDLVVSIQSPSIDPDGDPVTYLYTWFRDGAVVYGQGSATLSSSLTARDELWMVQVSATDGVGTSAVGTDSVVIGNSPPAIGSVSLTPDPVAVSDTMFCIPASVNDTDGDPVSFTYSWAVDGVQNGETGSQMSASGLVAGQTVTCTVTPSDGIDDGLPVTSNAVTVGNGAPSAPVVQIEPDPASTSNDLTVVIVTDSVDPENDPVTYSYVWSRDGVVQPTLTGDTVSSGETSRDEVWQVEVVPNDGTVDGTSGTDSLTIDNTPPTAPVVEIAPDPAAAGESLLATVTTQSTDEDGDGVTYSFTWSMSTTPTGTLTATGITGDTVASGTTKNGERWRVEVVPSDGTDDGPVATAEVVILDNDTPVGVADTFDLTAGCVLDASTGADVLANDTDPNGDPLTVSLVTDASNGTLILNSDGTFTYLSNDGYSDDSFTYEVSDGVASDGPISVTLTNIQGHILVDTPLDAIPGDGQCSLREAIEAANRDQPFDACKSGTGDDRIAFLIPAAIYPLQNFGVQEDLNKLGDLDIVDTLEILGCGAKETVIDAMGADRAIDVAPLAKVTLRELSVINGVSEGDPGTQPLGGLEGGLGGGLRSYGSSLVLSGVHFISNKVLGGAGAAGSSPGAGGGGGGGAARGGAVYVRQGKFALDAGRSGCLFEDNRSTGGHGGRGVAHGGTTGTGGGGGGEEGADGGYPEGAGKPAAFAGGGGGGGGSDCGCSPATPPTNAGGDGDFGGGGGGGGACIYGCTGGPGGLGGFGAGAGGMGDFSASAGGGGGGGFGGAVYLGKVITDLGDCTFVNNQAVGGKPGPNHFTGGQPAVKGGGFGGAFMSYGYDVTFSGLFTYQGNGADTDGDDLYVFAAVPPP